MDFNSNEHVTMVTGVARDFAEQYVRPHVMEWDEAQHFPIDALKKAGELGLMGVLVPEQYGGSNMGYF